MHGDTARCLANCKKSLFGFSKSCFCFLETMILLHPYNAQFVVVMYFSLRYLLGAVDIGLKCV